MIRLAIEASQQEEQVRLQLRQQEEAIVSEAIAESQYFSVSAAALNVEEQKMSDESIFSPQDKP